MWKITVFILLFYPILLFGQRINLVPDSSFEQYKFCSNNKHLETLNNCYSPTIGTPDYFNQCISNTGYGVPINIGGFQNARSGSGYVGFYLYNKSENDDREYISMRIKNELGKNIFYSLQLYINLANNNKYAISKSDFGVYFSKDSIFLPSTHGYKPLPFKPQVNGGNSNEFIEDTLNWVKLTFIFKSKGREKYFTLGNYHYDAKTTTKIVDSSNNSSFAYYYIDDVSLYEITPQDITVSVIKPNLNACYDSIGVKITNSGDSALDFVKHPFILNLDLKLNGTVVQTLQKTINNNQGNPVKGQPLAVDSSFWVYFSGITYPTPTGNYTIEVASQMAADGDSTNNFLDTTFYREVPVGNVSISDSSICKGESLQLFSQNVKGQANWQFSPNQQNWQNIGFADTLVYAPQISGFFRLAVCELYSDTLEVKVKPLPPIINAAFQFCSPWKQMLQLDKNDSISTINWYKSPTNGTPFHQGFAYSTTINESISYYLESIKDHCISKERGILKITIGGCELEIPNIFTPNGDSINDIFEYQNGYGKEIKTTIYNRWGDKIDEFTGASGWSGKGYKAGTYFYVIEADGEVYRGTVSLIK